jgi:hypothetical protein
MRLLPLFSLAFALVASPALALDPVDPSAASEGGCPALTAAKYPWLACTAGEKGAVSLATKPQEATWENTRNIPKGFDFTEGDGYWGPDLNPR